ncbi:M20 metallopeptidase family protein [Fodinibius sediminis]|uniref:Amidohydrolase n=1 Tax=Fodinibius sediminis TaxID=1214077 RepID=A0A521EYD7_9BACT|nr:amidohydrolase [Fodinibius sediminis]SMO88873.1 amidohydrolase [Fodinibius sediminis]
MDLNKLKERAEQYLDEMTAIRRHLHRHPELSYQEKETTRYILDKLDELGIPADRPLETGCVGVLEGERGGDRVIALRADIDALPITEEGEHKKGFLSENEGVAHCCGHDGHTANLLGAAHILSGLKSEIEGTVLFIFQPGEETLPGGGRLLCESGYLQEKGVDVIYGLHSNPNWTPGKIALRKGELMARPDEFEIEIIGRGGHAASPHETVDPIVMAAQVVQQIQTIVSRSVNPTEHAVVTVGKMSGGSAYNIIPEKVELMGTVRTFSAETAELIKRRLEEIVKGVTEAGGGRYEFAFNYGYPAVRNTDWATDIVVRTAGELLGEENVEQMDAPLMAGEDFAFYQQHFPGVFFFLGSGTEKSGSVYSWHHPKYNIDEDCFVTGAALMASLVFQPLPADEE